MTTMTLAPAPASAPLNCQPWCRTRHGNDPDEVCLAAIGDDAYTYLSQHTEVGPDGVGPAEITLGMIHDHATNRTTIELSAPEVTEMTIEEARAVHAALGRLLAMAEGTA